MRSTTVVPILLYHAFSTSFCGRRLGSECFRGRDAIAYRWLLYEEYEALRPSSQYASDMVIAQDFSGFSFVYNEKLRPLLIVFPKDDLCITVWSMVLAGMVYCCSVCWRAILLVDHTQTLEGGG